MNKDKILNGMKDDLEALFDIVNMMLNTQSFEDYDYNGVYIEPKDRILERDGNVTYADFTGR